MRTRFISILVLALALLTANGQRSTILAQGHVKAGTTTADILEAQPGTRPAAMGGAFVAVADDVNAVNYNPAGLAFIDKNELQFNQNNMLEGIISNNINWVYPLSEMNAKNINDFGVLAGGFNFTDYGQLPGRDASGNATSEFGAKDRIISISYGKAFNPNFSIGVTGREVRQEIYAIKAKGYSFDGGILFKGIINNLSVGLVAQNMGTKMKFDTDSEPLPGKVVLGSALTLFKDRLTLAADLNKPVNDYYYWSLGGEYWLTRVLTVQLGYKTKHDIGNGLTSGIGLNLREFEFSFLPVAELSLNYAYLPHGDLGAEHRLDLVLKMGVE